MGKLQQVAKLTKAEEMEAQPICPPPQSASGVELDAAFFSADVLLVNDVRVDMRANYKCGSSEWYLQVAAPTPPAQYLASVSAAGQQCACSRACVKNRLLRRNGRPKRSHAGNGAAGASAAMRPAVSRVAGT